MFDFGNVVNKKSSNFLLAQITLTGCNSNERHAFIYINNFFKNEFALLNGHIFFICIMRLHALIVDICLKCINTKSFLCTIHYL